MFFAAAESVKYIQFVYLAQWIDKKKIMIVVGGWFTLLGASNALHGTIASGANVQLADLFLPSKYKNKDDWTKEMKL